MTKPPLGKIIMCINVPSSVVILKHYLCLWQFSFILIRWPNQLLNASVGPKGNSPVNKSFLLGKYREEFVLAEVLLLAF